MPRRNQRSAEAEKWRGWYALARWRRRRIAQLAAEPLCRFCRQRGRVTAATVADHVIPHKGDPDLFWHGELQSLCADHHDRDKQQQERIGYSTAIGADGWPVDPSHPFNR